MPSVRIVLSIWILALSCVPGLAGALSLCFHLDGQAHRISPQERSWESHCLGLDQHQAQARNCQLTCEHSQACIDVVVEPVDWKQWSSRLALELKHSLALADPAFWPATCVRVPVTHVVESIQPRAPPAGLASVHPSIPSTVLQI